MILHTTFSALGDPTRFAIVERLLSRGPLAAGDLQGAADISAPAISRHLKILRQSGVITQKIDKQRRIYAVRPEAFMEINHWLTAHKEFWETSLDRLEQALKIEVNSND